MPLLGLLDFRVDMVAKLGESRQRPGFQLVALCRQIDQDILLARTVGEEDKMITRWPR